MNQKRECTEFKTTGFAEDGFRGDDSAVGGAVESSEKDCVLYAFDDDSKAADVIRMICSQSGCVAIKLFGKLKRCEKLKDALHSVNGSGLDVYLDLSETLGLSFIEDYAFTACKRLKECVIPPEISGIKRYAFYSCNNMETINIPQFVTVIGSSAFYYCSSLKCITLEPKTPPSLEGSVFFGCASLKEILVPKDAVEAYKSSSDWRVYAPLIAAAA